MDSGTRRNLVTYYFNFVVVAAVGFIVNPLLLAALGPVMFGIWKSLQRYLDFASVADGRASQALKWIVASRATLPPAERRRDIGAAVIVWFRWLPVAGLVCAGIVVMVPVLIKGVPTDDKTVVYAAAAILAANAVLAGLLTVPDSVVVGVNKGYKTMLVQTSVFVVSNLAMLLVAFSGLPLWTLAFVVLLAAAINAAVALVIAKRSIDWFGIARPTRSDLRRVFGYSAWTLGGMAVDKLFVACELIVISVMIGAIGVTQYTFTSYVMQFVLSIGLVTTSGFMPMLGIQLGASESSSAAERAQAVRQLGVAVAALGGGLVLAFNGEFVALWVGKDQYLGTMINVLLVVCGVQFALIRMDGQILDVTMKIAPKVLLGALSSAGGIVAGCTAFAITHSLAAALVSVIVLRFVSSIAFPVLVKRSIPGSSVPYRAQSLALVFLLLSAWVGTLMEDLGTLGVIAISVSWLLAAALSAWFGLVPKDTVRALVRRGSAHS